MGYISGIEQNRKLLTHLTYNTTFKYYQTRVISENVGNVLIFTDLGFKMMFRLKLPVCEII